MANETLEQLGNALEAAQQKIGAVAEEVSEQAYNELVAIRREKLRGLQEAGNDPFELTSYPQADFAAEVKESFVDVPEGEQGRSVCMAGRMMSKRVMGKASFADLRDTTGNIQLYVRRDDVGVEEYQADVYKRQPARCTIPRQRRRLSALPRHWPRRKAQAE